MVVKVFISSNQTEFSEERKFLYDELNKDSFFNETIKLYVFEEDENSTLEKVSGSLVRTKNKMQNDFKLKLSGIRTEI